MCRTQNDVRFFGLHIFCIDRQKFLSLIFINVFCPGKGCQAPDIGLFSSDHIASRKSHQDQYLRMFFSGNFFLEILIKLLILIGKLSRLLFPVKNHTQLFDRLIHAWNAAKI